MVLRSSKRFAYGSLSLPVCLCGFKGILHGTDTAKKKATYSVHQLLFIVFFFFFLLRISSNKVVISLCSFTV